MLDVNPGLIVWTIITFLILLVVLGRVAWKPLLKALQSREESIRDAIHQAEHAKREAERLLGENKAALDRANEVSVRVIKEGRELAEHMKGEILAKAQENAKAMIDQAKVEIQREKEAALVQLRNEVADLAITAAERILDENLDASRQKKILDQVIQQVPRN